MASGSYSNAYKGYTVKTAWSSTKDIAGNYSTVTGTHYLICASGWDLYVGSRTTNCTAGETKSCTVSGISTGGGSTITLGTTTHKVSHNSDGKKTITASTTFNIQATISGTYVSTITATGTMVLDDIPRASSLTASNGTLNTKQTLTINRASDSFSHTIKYTCGTASGTIVTKTTDTSVSWTPPLSLASQNTTGTSVSITLTTTTYNVNTGDTIGTSTKTISCTIPSSVKPTCSVSVSDSTGYATTYGGYIQGISKFQVTVTGTTSYSSPIASYSTTANGSTYTSASFTTGVITSSGTATITSKVTDKRGRSGTKSVTATVLEYNKPKITALSVIRCDEDGTENIQGEYVKVKYSCDISSLNTQNTLTSVIKYKKSSKGAYTTLTDINASTTTSYANRSVIIEADSGSSYDIELSITDNFDTTKKATSVSTAFTFKHFKGPMDAGWGTNLVDFSSPSDTSNCTLSFSNDTLTITGDDGSYRYLVLYDILNMSKIRPGKSLWFSFDSIDQENPYTLYIDIIETTITGSTTQPTLVSSKGTYASVTIPTNIDNIASYKLRIMVSPTTKVEGSDSITIIKPMLYVGTVTYNNTEYEPYADAVEPSMGLGKLAEFEGGLDIGFQTRFAAGLKFPLLKAETDLDDVRTPNFYVGENITYYNYANCPLLSGTFYLEVVAMGDSGQVRQRITSCGKTNSVTYERVYYQSGWGDWRDCYIGEEVIYDNESGSNGTITLTTAASQYVYLEIYYTDNNGLGGGYTKIYNPNGKTIELSLIEAGSSTTTYFRRTKYTISAKTITPDTASAGYVRISTATPSHTSGTNYLKITRVVGKR